MLRPKPPKAAGAAEVVAGATAAPGAGVGATVAVVALGAPNPGFVVQCSMGFFGNFSWLPNPITVLSRGWEKSKSNPQNFDEGIQ